MKKEGKKKGLSPVVASVLLIFLVLIIAAIIFLWARGFFSEQLEKAGESVEFQCGRVDLATDIAVPYGGGTKIVLDFSNRGDVDIYGVSIREAQGGNDEAHFHPINLASGDATRLEIILESDVLNQGTNDLEEIIVFPVLLGGVVGGNENKEYTCTEYPIRLRL